MRMRFLKKAGLYGKLMLLAIIMLMAVAVQPIFAFDNDFVTKNFDVDIDVKENHMIYVKERITVDFNQSAHHGITRFIPYKPKLYTIENIDSNISINDIDTKSKKDSEGHSYKIKSIQIGDEDKLLQGINTFEISYVIKAYKDDDKNFDFFSQNVFPTAWVTDVENSTISIRMPKKTDWNKADFYGGEFGSTDRMGRVFTKKIDKSGKRVVITGKNIPARYGVTVNVKLPQGYWVNPSDRSDKRFLLYGFFFIIPLILAILWFVLGRDPKPVETVEFYPPEAMTPAEIGYIIDGNVDRKDITTMIFYFASKGYLKIKEDENGNIRLTKICEIPQEEKGFARTLFNGIFTGPETVELDNLPENFGDDITMAKEQVENSFEYSKGGTHRIFTFKSKMARKLAFGLTIAGGVLSVFLIEMEAGESGYIYHLIAEFIMLFLGMKLAMTAFDYADSVEKFQTVSKYGLGIVFITAGAIWPSFLSYSLLNDFTVFPVALASLIVSTFFTVIMKARTKESAGLQGRIKGFKNFIKNAEYNRLKLLSEENPEYFFNIIPYAHVLGMASVWAKKFDGLNIQSPSWYEGDPYNALTPIWYYSMLGRFDNSIQEQYANVVSDSDSDIGGFGGGDFGGGGFSGGGFGGGGGGAW